jgi:hypothetical protein
VYGTSLKDRSSQKITLEVDGQDVSYNIIAFLPYNETHKRCGIVVTKTGE